MRIVLAVDEHALASRGRSRSEPGPPSRFDAVARILAPLVRAHEVVITHGIGSDRAFGTSMASALREAVPGLVTATPASASAADLEVQVETGLTVVVPTVSDLAAVAVAIAVEADALILLSDIDAVYRDFGTPAATPLRRITTEQAEALLTDGTVSPPRMATKLEAALRFATTGGFAVIAELADVEAALHRAAGTRVVQVGETRRTGLEPTSAPPQRSRETGSYRVGAGPGTDSGSSSPVSRRNGGYSSRISPA